jgi:hypothetical protein
MIITDISQSWRHWTRLTVPSTAGTIGYKKFFIGYGLLRLARDKFKGREEGSGAFLCRNILLSSTVHSILPTKHAWELPVAAPHDVKQLSWTGGSNTKSVWHGCNICLTLCVTIVTSAWLCVTQL